MWRAKPRASSRSACSEKPWFPHPEAVERAALRRPVERPRGERGAAGERGDRAQRHPQERGDGGEVAEEVGGGPGQGAPEAVRRDGPLDVGERERRLVREGTFGHHLAAGRPGSPAAIGKPACCWFLHHEEDEDYTRSITDGAPAAFVGSSRRDRPRSRGERRFRQLLLSWDPHATTRSS